MYPSTFQRPTKRVKKEPASRTIPSTPSRSLSRLNSSSQSIKSFAPITPGSSLHPSPAATHPFPSAATIATLAIQDASLQGIITTGKTTNEKVDDLRDVVKSQSATMDELRDLVKSQADSMKAFGRSRGEGKRNSRQRQSRSQERK